MFSSNDIDMKFGPVLKLDKRKTATSKKSTMTLRQQVLTSLLFSNLWPVWKSESWISDAWSVILTFSLIVTVYLTNIENRTKKIYNTALILLPRVKVLFLPKNANISKMKEVQVLKGFFSETAYLCTYIPLFKFLA